MITLATTVARIAIKRTSLHFVTYSRNSSIAAMLRQTHNVLFHRQMNLTKVLLFF
jgi:hypothetical protein